MRWVVLIFALSSLGVTGCDLGDRGKSHAGEDFNPRFIRVYGDGLAPFSADSAELALTIQEKKPTSQEALNSAAQRMARLIDAVKTAHSDQVRFVGPTLDVNPYYQMVEVKEDKETRYEEIKSPDKILGYVAGVTYQVQVFDLTKLPEILSKVAELGVEKFDGPNFKFSGRPEAAHQKAYVSAIADATDKAKAYAEHAGGKLGTVLRVDEAFERELEREAALPVQEVPVSIKVFNQLQLNVRPSSPIPTVQLPTEPPVNWEKVRILAVFQVKS